MRRKIVLFIIIAICFLLQTTVFRALTFANIGPNLLIIVVSSFGLMRGKKEGLWVGFFCGLLIDIFFGFYLGGYAFFSDYSWYDGKVYVENQQITNGKKMSKNKLDSMNNLISDVIKKNDLTLKYDYFKSK